MAVGPHEIRDPTWYMNTIRCIRIREFRAMCAHRAIGNVTVQRSHYLFRQAHLLLPISSHGKCENKNKLQALPITSSVPETRNRERKKKVNRNVAVEQLASAWRQSINFMAIITQIEVDLPHAIFSVNKTHHYRACSSAYGLSSMGAPNNNNEKKK